MMFLEVVGYNRLPIVDALPVLEKNVETILST